MVGSVPSIPVSPVSNAAVGAAKARGISVAGQIVALAAAMWRVRRERRALMSLDARMLKDIGLNAGDVERETARQVWDLPSSRSRRQG
jgi:uncharacterized protein YjiS (DUF1127 family)